MVKINCSLFLLLNSFPGKNEKVLFADVMQKYDRKFKPSPRECILTNTNVIILGTEKVKDGPNKGKFIKIIKRSIPFASIQSVSLRYEC